MAGRNGLQDTVGTHDTQEPLLWDDMSLELRSWQRGGCVDLLPVGAVVDETKMFPKVPSMNCSVTPLFCWREIFQHSCPSDLVCGVAGFDLSQLQDL